MMILLMMMMMGSMVKPHGWLVDPPSRNSAWRYGFPTPTDYDDSEQNCGGYGRQWSRNKGKCGVCGDPWDLAQPRPGEGGGTYGRGVIVRTYSPGQTVPVSVQVTANHRGYFEFRLCPHNNPSVPVSESCLEQNLLTVEGGGNTRYYHGQGEKLFTVSVKLPPGVTCSQCVLQWRYISGENWGSCAGGGDGQGCGPQEEFRSCADVAIFGDIRHNSVTYTNYENEDEDISRHSYESSKQDITGSLNGPQGNIFHITEKISKEEMSLPSEPRSVQEISYSTEKISKEEMSLPSEPRSVQEISYSAGESQPLKSIHKIPNEWENEVNHGGSGASKSYSYFSWQ